VTPDPSALSASRTIEQPAQIPWSLLGGTLVGLAAGLTAAAIWAGGSVVSRHLMTSSPLTAHDLACLRYIGAYPVVLVLLNLFPHRLRNDVPFHRFVVLLLLAGPLYQALLIFGYGQLPAGTGALIITGLMPIFALAIVIVTGWRLRGLITPVLLGSAVMVVAGVGLHLMDAQVDGSVSPVGLVVFVSAALGWALLNHLVGVWSVDPLRLTIALVAWSPIFLPLWALSRPPVFLLDMPARDLVLQIVAHAWLSGLVATGLFFLAVRRLGALSAALLQASIPVFAIVFGGRVLGEPATVVQVAGLALTIVGMLFAIISLAAARRRIAAAANR
jgi:drug/metabolite transporter (DMT)-like permease